MFAPYLKPNFLMPFIICMVISLFILWYQRARQPVHQFRPPLGETFLLGILLTMISAGVAIFVSKSIVSSEEIVESMSEEKKVKSYEGSTGSAPIPDQRGKGGSWDRLKYGVSEEERAKEAEKEQ